MDYNDFLTTKIMIIKPNGPVIDDTAIHSLLFPFQRDLTRWAIRKGRAAIFADTGMGKTLMQLEWARLIGHRTLIAAPLSVARQTVHEGRKIDLDVHYTRDGIDLISGINITNYEMLDHFDPDDFGAVVLDESSCLKSLDGKTRAKLIDMFRHTPYRLCCTATPAPNDIAEIANHAEFLGIISRADMLATFFVHDDEGWRLKGHAKEPFFKWLASWSMAIRKPSDLGYDNDGFILPELRIHPTWVQSDYVPEGQLFFTDLHGIQDRQKIRQATTEARVEEAVRLINEAPVDEQWIVWTGLNDESHSMANALSEAVEVQGSDSLESKIANIEAFQDGAERILVTKTKIAGFGMNLQNAHKMIFVGLNDSWESYYQAIRRAYRFGQKHPVDVYIVLSELEEGIYNNVICKEVEAAELSKFLIANVKQFEQEELQSAHSSWSYQQDVEHGKDWTLYLGDSADMLRTLETESIDLSVYSPPFLSLFTYSPTERDIGNSHTPEEFFAHFRFIIDNLLRITKPGRLSAVHVADVPALLVRDGYIGLKDFPGMTIKAFEDAGWIYHGRVTIDKNPQAQAIRTHSKALLFAQFEKDSSWSRPALADYILLFRKPGDNVVPIHPDIPRNEWILWARPVWYAADYTPGQQEGMPSTFGTKESLGIRETDTLNVAAARSEEDERHICPLQLGTIERCIRLWSNPGETVLSPFAGIGSEGYEAVRLGRKFIGIELKPEYWRQACINLRSAIDKRNAVSLFSLIEEQEPA